LGESYVRAIVAGQDCAGVFDRYLRSRAGYRAIYIFDGIQPVTICFALWQVEAVAIAVLRCASALFDTHAQ
jgi:hypothetical protein